MAAFSSLVGEVRALARALKERSPGGMIPTLIATRVGQPVALAMHAQTNQLLSAAGTMAGGYGADALALISECVLPRVPLNPLTQKSWSNGDATEALSRGGAEEGWVAQCQVTMLASRSGNTSIAAQPFRVDNGLVAWSSDIDSEFDPDILNALSSAFSADVLDPAQVPEPGAGHRIARADSSLPPDRGRVSLDVTITRMLDSSFTLDHPGGGAMLIARDDSEAVGLRAAGLSAGQFLVYHSE